MVPFQHNELRYTFSERIRADLTGILVVLGRTFEPKNPWLFPGLRNEYESFTFSANSSFFHRPSKEILDH